MQLPKGYESSTILPFMEDPIPWYTDVIEEQIKSKIREEEESESSSSSMQGYHTDKQQQDDDEGRSHTGDNTKQQTTSSSSSEATICRSICFNIQEGQSNHIDLSFGMQLVPTLSPSHIPSVGPTNIMPTFMPTIKQTYSKSEVEPSTGYPTASIGPTFYPTISIHPSISSTPTHEQSLYWNIGPITTSNLRITLFGIDTIHNAVEWNEIMALYIEDYFNDHDDDDSDGSNGKRLSHATVWDVDTSVILTGQSSKVIHNDDIEGDPNNNEITKEQRNSPNDRRLKGHIAVEIIYNQVTSYKTSNPEDIDVSYLLQEPFSTTINRYEFISYLQTLSLDYDDVTSVSGVRLPPYMTEESTVIATPSNDTVVEKESMKDVGVKYALPVFLAGIILILVVQFARRKLIVIGAADGSVSSVSSDEKDKTGSGSRHSSSGKLRDSGSSKKSDGLLHFGGENISDEEEADEPHSSIPPPHTWQVGTHLDLSTHGSDIEVQDIYPESLLGKTPPKKRISPPIEPTFPTTTRDTSPRTFADSTFNLSEIIIDIVIPPGRVGCIIDSSPKKGPYICEVDNTSPIRNEVQVGDRIIAVDEVDVSRMNAINVSKLLGKRSQNEERVLTILRECVYEYISPESPEIHVNVIQQRSSVSPLASSGVNTSSEGEMNFTSSSSEELTGGNNSAMDPPGWKKTQHSMSL